jgi:hypothetical protein
MLAVVLATGHIAFVPTVLCARNPVMYTHHQKDTYVILFAAAAVRL